MAIEFVDDDDSNLTVSGIDFSNQSFSISMWLLRSRNAQDGLWAQGSETPDGAGVEAQFPGAGGTLRFTIIGTNLDSVSTITDTTTLHHLAFTYNVSTNLMSLYIDGVLDNSTTSANDYTGSGTFHIGEDIITRECSAIMDDFRIYDNVVLSAAEVATIFACRGHDDIRSGLVGRYTFMEKAPGQTATGAGSIIDLSGNGNHATPVSSPTYRANGLAYRRLVA